MFHNLSNNSFNPSTAPPSTIPGMGNRTRPVHATATPLSRRFEEGALSRKGVAKALGVEVQNVTNWLARGVPSEKIDDLAELCGITPEQYKVEAGMRAKRKAVAPQPPSPDASQLSPEAIDVARAWMQLTPPRRHAIREWVFLETVVAKHYPWLMVGRPHGESYNEYEKSVESDLVRITKQLMMEKERDKK